ncbi:MAG: hypothetical protein IKY10_01400 [Clostridia bacterium]|nr:hypothetical protein [Clostridia bacterium]
MAKTKDKKRILENQLMFEFFGELDTVIKPRKKLEKVKVEIEKPKKPKAIKPNHKKKNRKVRRF